MTYKKKSFSRCPTIRGKGILNNLINKLPFEIHLPGYQYCGPGTKLSKRLARGDSGINLLDRACKEHDIAYSQTTNTKLRNLADIQLAERAWNRVKAKDSSFGEKANAWFVTNAMKAKAKFGMGCNNYQAGQKKSRQKKKKKKSKRRKSGEGLKIKSPLQILQQVIKKTRRAIKSKKPRNVKSAIQLALNESKKYLSGKRIEKNPQFRVIPLPKSGGFLPLLPIFAGLSALGALGGGAAGIAKAINSANEAKNQLSENQRHNRQMEAIAMGKGFFLKPHRQGFGLFLNPKNY